MTTKIRCTVILMGMLVLLACGPVTMVTTTPSSSQDFTSTRAAIPQLSPSTATPTVMIELPTATQTLPMQLTVQPTSAIDNRGGDPVQLDSITMESRNEGWGLSGALVLITRDGGQTWKEVTPPENFLSGAKYQTFGAFLDSQTAWIIFSVDGLIPPETAIWHTIDGGQNWTASAPLSHQVIGEKVWAEFAVLDAQNVWVLVRGVYTGAGTHFNHELYHTADGGLTWTSLDGQISDDYTGMAFADTKFGLRTLQTTGAYAAGPPAYDVTTDGGGTWEGRELPPPPGAPDLFTQYPYCETYQPVLLSARSIRMLMSCFDYGDPPKQFTSYFYASQDGGTTWQSVHLPDRVQAAQAQLIYSDTSHALLLGSDIYMTTSDGQSWSPVAEVNWDGKFTFVDPQFGWAIARLNGESDLVQTVDGAATWTLIKPMITR